MDTHEIGAEMTELAMENAHSNDSQKPTYVVGIGASAGGLEALEELFDHMPTNSGLSDSTRERIDRHSKTQFRLRSDTRLGINTSLVT